MRTNGFMHGSHVICQFRLPSTLQPWVSTFWVGTVLEPRGCKVGSGPMTETEYCETYGKVRVAYSDPTCPGSHSFEQLDPADSLIAISDEHAMLSHEEKVRIYLGSEAHDNLLRARGVAKRSLAADWAGIS